MGRFNFIFLHSPCGSQRGLSQNVTTDAETWRSKQKIKEKERQRDIYFGSLLLDNSRLKE